MRIQTWQGQHYLVFEPAKMRIYLFCRKRQVTRKDECQGDKICKSRASRGTDARRRLLACAVATGWPGKADRACQSDLREPRDLGTDRREAWAQHREKEERKGNMGKLALLSGGGGVGHAGNCCKKRSDHGQNLSSTPSKARGNGKQNQGRQCPWHP